MLFVQLLDDAFMQLGSISHSCFQVSAIAYVIIMEPSTVLAVTKTKEVNWWKKKTHFMFEQNHHLKPLAPK